MTEIMVKESQSCDLKELVAKFIPESIGKEIEKATSGIYPLQNTFIRKVKILKAPKFDLGKLMEVSLIFIEVSKKIVLFYGYLMHYFLVQFFPVLLVSIVCILWGQVHGDYSEDVGVKVDRPAEDSEPKAEAELVGA